jgi:hypothetical protein
MNYRGSESWDKGQGRDTPKFRWLKQKSIAAGPEHPSTPRELSDIAEESANG